MNTEAILWRSVLRDELPELLFDDRSTLQNFSYSSEPGDLYGSALALGYMHSRLNTSYNPACVVVVQDESAAETLSWLRVYAPETFPLSQCARVVGHQDWRTFRKVHPYGNVQREDIWSSVILGEAIAQGESNTELSSIPLSRASACFSMAIARAACIYGSDEATRTCSDRLRKLESDRRFSRRSVSVDELVPIWAMANGDHPELSKPEDIARSVLSVARRYMQSPENYLASPASLNELSGLSSNSIEERVISFNRLYSELRNSQIIEKEASYSSVLLAAAAFMVGRGTSHEFLVRRVSKQFPSAPAWFGLIAALAGPSSWDANWARMVKGIERQIRSNFDWSETTGFDLCWLEYSWLAMIFKGEDTFSAVPKLASKVLSVEVIPGATCQLRLAHSSPDVEVRALSARDREMNAVISQFVVLANRAKNLIEEPAPSAYVQKSLLPDESVPYVSQEKKPGGEKTTKKRDRSYAKK